MPKGKINITDIQPNPNNPRLIKDHRFEKLKENIKRYPKFLEKRPIVIDSFENPVILGGNMRYKALLELGYKEIPDEWVKQATGFTDEEKQAFIILDNVEFGESDWEKLANEWDETKLKEWGLEIKIDFQIPAEKRIIPDHNKVHFMITAPINWKDDIEQTINPLRGNSDIEILFQGSSTA